MESKGIAGSFDPRKPVRSPKTYRHHHTMAQVRMISTRSACDEARVIRKPPKKFGGELEAALKRTMETKDATAARMRDFSVSDSYGTLHPPPHIDT